MRKFVPSLYRYHLGMKTPDGEDFLYKYYLTVHHGELTDWLTEEELASIEPNHPVITEHTAADLRTCQEDGVVDYVRDGIRYTYCDGDLSEIYWQSNGMHYWISMEEPLPSDSDVISASELNFHFLNKENTAGAIAWFDELITSVGRAAESGS